MSDLKRSESSVSNARETRVPAFCDMMIDIKSFRLIKGYPVKLSNLLTILLLVGLAVRADAHFVLISPAASLVQNVNGDPQKIGPCGGVSANPGRGTPANPGVPSGAVTNVKGGSNLPLLIQESIF